MKTQGFFTPLAWLVMACCIFMFMSVLSIGQIAKALAVYNMGFQTWMIPVAALPILGAVLVRNAWKEYKESEQ